VTQNSLHNPWSIHGRVERTTVTPTPLRLLQPLGGDPWDIESYQKAGGYKAWENCVRQNNPDGVVAELKKSSLRGRGGAGFPTGLKWEKVVHHRTQERYFVCNAGEHEPGTSKDRYLIKHFPHQLIEGCLIASHTVGAKESYIYLNAEFEEERVNFTKAIVSYFPCLFGALQRLK